VYYISFSILGENLMFQ